MILGVEQGCSGERLKPPWARWGISSQAKSIKLIFKSLKVMIR